MWCEFLYFLMPYHITYSISTKKRYVARKIKKIWISVWKEIWFKSLEYSWPKSEKLEGFHKSDNFINNIALGTSLFVFCDLNHISHYNLQYISSRNKKNSFFQNAKIVPFKNLQFYIKMTDIWDFLPEIKNFCSKDGLFRTIFIWVRLGGWHTALCIFYAPGHAVE